MHTKVDQKSIMNPRYPVSIFLSDQLSFLFTFIHSPGLFQTLSYFFHDCFSLYLYKLI